MSQFLRFVYAVGQYIVVDPDPVGSGTFCPNDVNIFIVYVFLDLIVIKFDLDQIWVSLKIVHFCTWPYFGGRIRNDRNGKILIQNKSDPAIQIYKTVEISDSYLYLFNPDSIPDCTTLLKAAFWIRKFIKL